MNNLTKTLLCGAALCAFVAVPAVAENAGPYSVTALHGNRVVTKTKMHRGATHVVSTLSVFGYETASTATVGTKYELIEFMICNTTAPLKVVKAPKKTTYGKLSISTESYSNCGHLDVNYEVTKQPAPNATDIFSMAVKTQFKNNGAKYKGTLNLDFDIMYK